MKPRLVWLVLCLIWGSTWLFIKIGLADLPPITFAGIRFVIATPPGYELADPQADRIMSKVPSLDFVSTHDPIAAVRDADAIYADTWVSMGQEKEKAQRVRDFADFQINEKLLSSAPKHVVVLHCLPAYRGLEITESVMEGKQSLVFPQAENRLHFQKGLLAVLMAGA